MKLLQVDFPILGPFGEEMSNSIKALVGKRVTKLVEFMGTKVEIFKLTVGEVKELQVLGRSFSKKLDTEDLQAPNDEGLENTVERDADGLEAAIAAAEREEEEGMSITRKIVRMGVRGGSDLSDEDFLTFPLNELAELAREIMVYSGVADKGKSQSAEKN